MEQRIKYLETYSTNPFFNLAFEEYVLKYRTEGDYLILWQNENTIVVGLNQNTEAEINRQFVQRNNINVVRRSTGGGAVYHDLGNLNYSFISDVGDIESLSASRFMQPIVSALRELGLDAECSGRNDIIVNSRKVSGTAQRICGNRILHHGTLLFDSDRETIQAALNVSQDKFKDKSIKSVRSRIGNIRDELKKDMELYEFWEHIKSRLTLETMVDDRLAPEELSMVEKIRDEKYMQWSWNYGRSPKYDMIAKRRWTGGELEIYLSVADGLIKDIEFKGDFMALKPIDNMTDSLRECRFTRADLVEKLSQWQIGLYFGSITLEQILDTIFPQ